MFFAIFCRDFLFSLVIMSKISDKTDEFICFENHFLLQNVV